MEAPDKQKIWTPSWKGAIITVFLAINIILIRIIEALVYRKGDYQIREPLLSEFELPTIKELYFTTTKMPIGDLCPPNWLLHGDHCYYYSDKTSRTWNQSRDYCKKMRADLLVIKNQEQQEFIKRTLRQQELDTYWIGLQHDGDGWRWVDGEHYNSSLFQIKSRSAGQCVLMFRSTYYQMSCNSASRWTCLKEAMII